MRISRRIAAAGAAMLCGTALSVTSCSVGPQSMPNIGSGTKGGYTITLHFTNVMNLPPGGYIMMNGLEVGNIGAVDVSDADVAVTAKLKAGTRIPANAHATVRQDTLLGDTYIAFDNDNGTPNSADFLSPGASVPVSRTTSPPTLEDTMATLALFINGGSIHKVEEMMTRVNAVMPSLPDVRKLASIVAVDMRDLSQNTADIDDTLNGIDKTAVAIDARSATWNQVMLNPQVQHLWRSLAISMYRHVGTLLPSIGSIFEGGAWLDPMFESLADTAGAGRGIWDTAPTAAEKISTFLRTVVLPFAQNPAVDVRSVTAPNGDQLVGDMENVLRMLGAMK